ncbi:copper amine oxidase N-terminal domain-containing protein [Paenibacillus sp. CC-CFT747]|nr:copper amine oxidase N-terminal domain-containing protein [Paenibacillus sp. CC-CFT747]
MKKFILGLGCGMALTAATAVLAADTIPAYWFPATFEVNGQTKEIGSEYTVLNYNGHSYVPIRFAAESLGLGIRYIDNTNVISIRNEPTNVDEEAKTIWLVKYRVTIGMDESEVKKLLGEPSVERTNDDSQQAVWRYDLSPVEGYTYEDLHKIDVTGLEQGKIKAQLIMHWSDEGQVDRTALWYKTSEDKWIHVYYLYEDGSTTEALYE